MKLQIFFSVINLSKRYVALFFISFLTYSEASEPCLDIFNKIIVKKTISERIKEQKEVLLPIKNNIASVDSSFREKHRLPQKRPQKNIDRSNHLLSPGMTDPMIELARIENVVSDFKILSGAKSKKAWSSQKKNKFYHETLDLKTSKERIQAIQFYIGKNYTFTSDLVKIFDKTLLPRWEISPYNDEYNVSKLVKYIEEQWTSLARRTRHKTHENSILELPYPLLIPSEKRFDESYYWDSYFAIQGLLCTGRIKFAEKILENLTYLLEKYGFVPNGTRDFYLSRSQVPFYTSMIMDIIKERFKKNPSNKSKTIEWLKKRGYPAAVRELDFWNNPKNGRFDPATGLNKHSDFLNTPRPERHSMDKELSEGPNDIHGLGKTYRDTRSAAESGEDFSKTFGSDASQIAPIFLNSMIYKSSNDLVQMAKLLNKPADVKKFKEMAKKKKEAILKYLWNEEKGMFINYNLKEKKHMETIGLHTFAPMFVQLVDQKKAERLMSNFHLFDAAGGPRSSTNRTSPHQWDGDNGWAPLVMILLEGMKNYGFHDVAYRVAKKWVSTQNEIFEKHHTIYERINVETQEPPSDKKDKYPTQEGFLWTNASILVFLKNYLGAELQAISAKNSYKKK